MPEPTISRVRDAAMLADAVTKTPTRVSLLVPVSVLTAHVALAQSIPLQATDAQVTDEGDRHRGFLHDIRMLAIPPSVLLKAGPPKADEFERIKSDTVIGAGNRRGVEGREDC